MAFADAAAAYLAGFVDSEGHLGVVGSYNSSLSLVVANTHQGVLNRGMA